MKTFRKVLTAVLVLGAAAQAGTLTYVASLSGANESPANASTGTGSATIIIDDVAQTLEVQVQFSGLLGNVTASHIHCCAAVAGTGTAGVATVTPTFTGFPSGVTSGTYDHTFDLTASSGTYNNSFVTANGGVSSAEAVLLAGLLNGKAYLNIHTSAVPGGEIRGFLTAATPEPASFLLAGAALAGLAIRRRRR